MRALDFFCGAGGLTHGLRRSGIEVTSGVDADPRCRESFERNNAGVAFVEDDVRCVSIQTVFKLLGSRKTSDLLLAGCAPCQPFSSQRKRKLDLDGEPERPTPDATLLSVFARLVEEILPAFVLIENVPGLARVPGRSTHRRFLSMLKDNGYGFVEGVLDAKAYGVPQNRRRYVLIAAKGRSTVLPPPTHGRSKVPFATVRGAIAHFPPLRAGEADPLVSNHVAANLEPINLQRIASTPKNGGDRRTWQVDLRLDCHSGAYEGHTDVYGRMRWDAPAPTLTGRCNSLSNGRYGHPEQDRAISLREAASLQTFPDAYVFYGVNQHIARQIGNAVPVRFAERLGAQLVGML